MSAYIYCRAIGENLWSESNCTKEHITNLRAAHSQMVTEHNNVHRNKIAQINSKNFNQKYATLEDNRKARLPNHHPSSKITFSNKSSPIHSDWAYQQYIITRKIIDTNCQLLHHGKTKSKSLIKVNVLPEVSLDYLHCQ